MKPKETPLNIVLDTLLLFAYSQDKYSGPNDISRKMIS